MTLDHSWADPGMPGRVTRSSEPYWPYAPQPPHPGPGLHQQDERRRARTPVPSPCPVFNKYLRLAAD